MMRQRSWKNRGALLILGAVWLLCAVCNTGLAWWGGPARPVNMAATGVYIATATALSLLSKIKMVWTKTMWWFSRLSFLCCLVCWFCSLDNRAWGLLFAPLAAIPFYGLRMWIYWDLTYLAGAGISLIWIVLTSRKKI